MPEGMNPSGVNDWARAFIGAVKRWYNWTIPATTGGTTTAYTLTYTPAPGALADGMPHRVLFNATNGAAPTLNVNSLGAKAIHKFSGGAWGAVAAGDLVANSVHLLAYNLADTSYRILDSAAPLGTGFLAVANNLSDVASLVTTRSNLKVDQRTTVADLAYTVLSTDYLVAYTSLSVSRTVTLPAASTFNAGRRLVIIDESGSASSTVAISLAPNGTDTIAGSNTTQVIINIPRGRIELECNGTNGWHVIGDWCVRYVSVLGADVALNNTGTYFDTVSVAQGTVGTWRVVAKACVTSGAVANVNAKLWDATTVIDSGRETVAGASQAHMIPMYGDITSPAGNIKVSVNDASRTDGTCKYNFSGNSKDTSLIVWRVA